MPKIAPEFNRFRSEMRTALLLSVETSHFWPKSIEFACFGERLQDNFIVIISVWTSVAFVVILQRKSGPDL